MSAFAPSVASSISTSVPRGRQIGAWWRRILAFMIDDILICLVLFILSLPFGTVLPQLGNWSRVIAFAVALPYFVRFNSYAGRGQTIGKRILSLEVVDARGNLIGREAAFFRYVVLALPFVLAGIVLSAKAPFILSLLLTFFATGIYCATFYLISFNRRTRQGVHDLVAETYVVDARSSGRFYPQPIWKMHWYILGYFCVLLLIGSLLYERLMTTQPYAELRDDARTLSGLDDVQGEAINRVVDPTAEGTEGKYAYVVTVTWSADPANAKDFAGQVADVLREHDPAITHSRLRINLQRIYSLGFLFGSYTNSFDYPPDSDSPVDATPAAGSASEEP